MKCQIDNESYYHLGWMDIWNKMCWTPLKFIVIALIISSDESIYKDLICEHGSLEINGDWTRTSPSITLTFTSSHVFANGSDEKNKTFLKYLKGL